MKKRLLALALAGLMVCTTASVVFAEADAATEATEETEIKDYTMDMMDNKLYDGTWVSFAGGFDLYLPTDWDVLEVSDELAEAGIMWQAKAPDDENGMNISVSANQAGDDFESLEALAADLTTVGYTDVEYANFNDIPAVFFTTDSTYGLCFVDSDSILYTVQIGPTVDEVKPYAMNICLSLSVTPTEEEAAE